MIEYTNLFNFSGLRIDNALRLYLDFVELQKESQQIDRVIQIFAKKYFNDNAKEEIFKSSDASYGLAYLLLILQTSLHNENVSQKERLKLEDLMKIAGGLNDGESFSQAFLKVQ